MLARVSRISGKEISVRWDDEVFRAVSASISEGKNAHIPQPYLAVICGHVISAVLLGGVMTWSLLFQAHLNSCRQRQRQLGEGT
jgi:hypothetical protein